MSMANGPTAVINPRSRAKWAILRDMGISGRSKGWPA
jgi:hypothetical protein